MKEVQCYLYFSKEVKCEISPVYELFEMDLLTVSFQNESALRQYQPYRDKIIPFFQQKANYQKAISDASKRMGRILLEYKGFDHTPHHLAPFYQEDLAILGMKKLEKESLIAATRKKTLSSLKAERDNTLGIFFQHFSFLFASQYALRQGYRTWTDDLVLERGREEMRKNLFKLLRQGLTLPKEADIETVNRIYFRARVIYDYMKKEALFSKKEPKRSIENLHIESASFLQTTVLNKEFNQEVLKEIVLKESKRCTRQEKFLEEYLRMYPEERGQGSMPEVALAYEESREERCNCYKVKEKVSTL